MYGNIALPCGNVVQQDGDLGKVYIYLYSAAINGEINVHKDQERKQLWGQAGLFLRGV